MKILFKIEKNSLIIQNRKKLSSEHKNMLNTNVISNNELVFSDEYIKTNDTIVVSFLNGLINEFSITKIIFQNNEVASLILPILPRIKNIISLYFASDEVFQYVFYEYLKKCKSIKFVSCNFIPCYLFELLDECGIIPESRDEILFTSHFMEANKLDNYNALFYKYIVDLDFPLSEEDIEDFNTFCKINKHLKIINITIPNKTGLDIIISILRQYNIKHVTIVINSDITDLDLINFLQKNSKKLNKRDKINIKLKYSKYYIKENIASEANNRILSSCALIILGIILMVFGYVLYDNYASNKKVQETQDKIHEFIIGVDPTEYHEINEDGENVIKNGYIMALKTINPEVVGWIHVNNTAIDYAVTQHNDNEYYLKHNLYNEYTTSGWVFMDYENNPIEFDDNTILYAHHRYSQGTMFGTLSNVIKKSWYTNKDNQIITFENAYGTYKFRVFSTYITSNLTDYITTTFPDKESKQEFIDTITKRSYYNFNVNVDLDDHILTLSTCHNSDRLVLHAVLIDE